MKVKALSQIGGDEAIADAAVVLIEDAYGNLVAVASEYGPTILISKIGDSDFLQVCKSLGLGEIPQVTTIAKPKVPAGAQLLAGPKPW